jgi:PAS domain S-box-containing protein
LPSGELSFWENTANPIRDARGEVVSCLEIGRDITERKKQEQALADELTRRRLLVDQSLDGIVVLDVDAKVVEANRRFAEMLGYTLEEVPKLHTWDWDKNFPRKKILEMGRNVDEKGLHVETKHTRKDGSVIDVDISINGAMLGEQKLIFCVCRDITERKKMEEALKLAAEEWRHTFDSISDAVSIHDRDFQILRANKAFADIFHLKPHQIIGRYCYELHSGGKPISGCPHKQTLATGKPAAAEFYESHLGKYLLESTSPIFDDKGEVVGTVHITRDITAQKQQNERLMMADRLASIGELAAGTAHELNNPLTSVIGFSQLVMEKDIPDDIREDLKLIYNEAQRAANVTKNLLTFGRKHAPVKQPNQINNIIEDVLKLRAYEHKVNGIEVKRQLAPDLPEIMVDYFQMQQVFLNIIINAEHFMTEAHNRGTLTITTKKQNSTVRISIADDGPGIPRENLSRIFNPFFTTKEAGKGTGLGLSICHGIVSEHGGQIHAKSQPGKGATIVIELPINSR